MYITVPQFQCTLNIFPADNMHSITQYLKYLEINRNRNVLLSMHCFEAGSLEVDNRRELRKISQVNAKFKLG